MTSIYVVLVLYMIALFFIGVYFTTRNKTATDFLLAGRNLSLWPAVGTLIASMVGGGLMTGTAQYAYDSGKMMLIYGGTAGLGMILAALVVKKMTDFTSYGTVTEYLEARFDSKFLRVACAFLSMIALLGILGGQVAAVVGILSAIGFENTTMTAVLAMVVIIALTAMGGLMAVTATDCYQIIIVIIGVIWITVAAVSSHGGFAGIDAALAQIPDLAEGYMTTFDGSKVLPLAWMILPGIMYTMIGQDAYQRLFACKTHKIAVRASVLAGIGISVVSLLPAILGLVARIDHPELAASGNSAAAFATLAISTLPSWGVGIVVAAVLSAILSTADSLLSAAASHFMNDFWLLFVAKDADPNDKSLLLVSRIFTIVGGAAAVIVSMALPSILDACFYSYYIYTAGVFCPIVFGVFWKKTTKEGAIAGLVVGAVFVMLALFGVVSAGSLPAEILSGLISAAAVIVVSLLTGKKAS